MLQHYYIYTHQHALDKGMPALHSPTFPPRRNSQVNSQVERKKKINLGFITTIFFFFRNDPKEFQIYFFKLLHLECSNCGMDISPRALSSPTSPVSAVTVAVPCLSFLVPRDMKCTLTSMGLDVPLILKEFSQEAASRMNNCSRFWSLITSSPVSSCSHLRL